MGIIASVALVLALLVARCPVVVAAVEPIAFDPEAYVPVSACDGMAYAAQTIADMARASHPGDDAAALAAFDATFATLYIGHPMRTLADALALLQSGGDGRTFVPGSPYVGETGFRLAFLDTGPASSGLVPEQVDQTHHAAAYLSAGIHGLSLVARLHAATDNDGDARLGGASFRLGASLRTEPARLETIGDVLRGVLCDPVFAGGAALLGTLPPGSRAY